MTSCFGVSIVVEKPEARDGNTELGGPKCWKVRL